MKKKNFINGLIEIKSCALRLRYKKDGTKFHNLEIRDEYANCITSINTDSMILEVTK